MSLLCRWFGHKWERDGWYGKTSPYVIWGQSPEKLYKRYACKRCEQKAVEFTIGGHEYDNPYLKIRVMPREIMVETEEEQ